MTTATKVSASVAVTLLPWLILVIAAAFGGLVGIVELSIVAGIWLVAMYFIWRR